MKTVLSEAHGYRLELRSRNEPYEFALDVQRLSNALIAAEQAERALTLQAIDAKWLSLFDDLRAGGWRRIRRIIQDKQYRRRTVTVELPVWLTVTLAIFGFSGGRY